MKRLLIAVGLLGGLAAAQGYHRHFHIHQTSLTSFVATCDNGAQPIAGKAEGGELEVTCGK